MKKIILYALFLSLIPLGMSAQSSMTDEQVMRFVAKEHKSGTSNAQIVTKLMQNGVDISQIRRVRKKYERQINNQGLGTVADETIDKADDRSRKNNGEKKEGQLSNYRLSPGSGYQHSYDENDEEYMTIRQETIHLLGDSIETEAERAKGPKVFGRDIFNKKNLSFEPNMNIATPQNYRLGPGDAVIIDVYGASQKSIQATVSPDGDVTIPDYGPVRVSGLTVAQANGRLHSTLGARYSSSKVRLTVGQTKTIMVNVYGEVKAPGTYTLSAFSSVFHALYMAGGTNDLGTLRNIKVYRGNKLVTSVDVYDYILNGKLSGNIRLADNDVIYVGPYDCLVNITGKVKRPMYYEMRKSESVGTLLKYSGGFTGDAYTKSVRLVRKTGREYAVFNVEEFDMNSFRVADGDSVSIDSILPRYANTVEVKGAVFRPGLYQLGGEISSIRGLVTHAEGLTEEAFTNRAVMHRMKSDRSLEVISVDIAGIMNGTVADIPLRENDILFIPTKPELQTQRTITIHGEVQYPGVYQYADNETIEDFVLQAGGLKDQASTVKVDVSRRVNNPKALTTDSIISETFTLSLKEGFVVDGQPGFTLMPFDEVYVRKSPAFSSQKNVYVEGQAMFAGTYTLNKKNERLSDIVRKAGGVTDLAYVQGARILRRTTPGDRAKIETLTRLLQAQTGGNRDSLNAALLQLSDTYPVGIELDKALENPGGDADLVLCEGDRLVIPEYNGTVKISGNVMYPNTVAFEKGRRAAYYIDEAGGWGNRAKKGRTFIIYMNGKVARVGHNAKVRPGCEIVVPSKPKRDGSLVSQWLGIGTSVASIATMIATIANLSK